MRRVKILFHFFIYFYDLRGLTGISGLIACVLGKLGNWIYNEKAKRFGIHNGVVNHGGRNASGRDIRKKSNKDLNKKLNRRKKRDAKKSEDRFHHDRHPALGYAWVLPEYRAENAQSGPAGGGRDPI
jgi:hypothetical protein